MYLKEKEKLDFWRSFLIIKYLILFLGDILVKWNNLGRSKSLYNINIDFVVIFRSFGDDWVVGVEIIDELEVFMCLMYGYVCKKFFNILCSLMLKKMVGEDVWLIVKLKVDLFRFFFCRDNWCFIYGG